MKFRIALILVLIVTVLTMLVHVRVKATYTPVAAGLVTFTSSGACPNGWTEYTAARGRIIVGLPSGGTPQATVGTELSNSENRAVGQHTHAQDAHNHTQDAHNHTQDAHNHTQNSHNHTQNSHFHTLSNTGGNPDVSTGTLVTVVDDAGSRTSSSVTAVNNAETAINQAQTATNQAQTATNQAQTATNQNSGSVAGTNAPYRQLMACEKL